jgi:hypothetical protein
MEAKEVTSPASRAVSSLANSLISATHGGMRMETAKREHSTASRDMAPGQRRLSQVDHPLIGNQAGAVYA